MPVPRTLRERRDGSPLPGGVSRADGERVNCVGRAPYGDAKTAGGGAVRLKRELVRIDLAPVRAVSG
jgi:hypothetical protein